MAKKRLRETLNIKPTLLSPQIALSHQYIEVQDCQKHKLAGHCYGILPKQEVWIAPREEVAIDLIGPWKVKVNG